jgi:hypothetical protein
MPPRACGGISSKVFLILNTKRAAFLESGSFCKNENYGKTHITFESVILFFGKLNVCA